jgi:hypothetical protein
MLTSPKNRHLNRCPRRFLPLTQPKGPFVLHGFRAVFFDSLAMARIARSDWCVQ